MLDIAGVAVDIVDTAADTAADGTGCTVVRVVV